MQKIKAISKVNLGEIYGKDKIDAWEERYAVFNNEDVKKWIESKIRKFSKKGKNPKKFSITGYLNELNKYCKFYKCENPTDLLEEHIDDRNERLMNYLTEMIKLGKNEVSVVNNWQARIKGFYSARGSPITEGIESFSAGLNKDEMIFERDDLKLFIAKLHRPEYRLLMKTQALLGLRVDDVLEELTSGKYKIEKYKKHYFVRRFVSQKWNVIINFMFLPSELTTLMQSVYNTDLTKLDLTTLFQTKKGTRIKQYDYLDRIKAIGKELGITQNVKTHCVRKYFDSSLEDTKDVKEWFKEHLMGHKAKDLSESYNTKLRKIDYFYEKWLNVEKSICIDCEIYDATNEQIVELTKEMANKEEQIKILVKQNLKFEKQMGLITELLKVYKPILTDNTEHYDKIKKELFGENTTQKNNS